MPYEGRKFDPKHKASQPRRHKGVGSVPQRCKIVSAQGTVAEFSTRKDAGRALAMLVQNLPPKKDPRDADVYWIENLE